MKLIIAGREIEVSRARLRLWFELEDWKDKIRKSAGRGETVTASDLICSYLSAATCESSGLFRLAPWYETAGAFSDLTALNAPRLSFPMLETPHEDVEAPAWDYEGRGWYVWMHLLASAYGWSAEYIDSLEIETGVALIEEILIDDQLGKEWDWGLSENAFEYIPATKQSHFRPMPRPRWMELPAKPIKKIILPKSILPMGEVIDLSRMGLHGTSVN